MLFVTLFIFLILIVVAAVAARGLGSPSVAAQLRKIAFVVGGVVVVLMVLSTVTVIKAGHVGIVDLFGRVSTTTLKSGLQFVNPFARVIQMSIQTLEMKETMEVPSKEGLTIRIDISVLYHLDPEKAADVYRTARLGRCLAVRVRIGRCVGSWPAEWALPTAATMGAAAFIHATMSEWGWFVVSARAARPRTRCGS